MCGAIVVGKAHNLRATRGDHQACTCGNVCRSAVTFGNVCRSPGLAQMIGMIMLRPGPTQWAAGSWLLAGWLRLPTA